MISTPKPISTHEPSRRMALDKVTSGKKRLPHRLLVFGTEGIGKSTFALGAPKPIFLDIERGTELLEADRFPLPETWRDVLDAVHLLGTQEHQYETLVIDTLDALEYLVWNHCVTRDSTPAKKIVDIEDYGYGKGYVKAVEEWLVLLSALERLREARKMHIILLGHSIVRSFKNPEGDDFDRYELKIHRSASGVLKEWCDGVFFANYETYAYKDEKTKRVRGVSTGARILHTERSAAFDAKNRYGLPVTIPLSWDDFEAAASTGRTADPATLVAEISRQSKLLGPEIEKKAAALVAAAKDDTARLAQINNRLTAKLAEKEG